LEQRDVPAVFTVTNTLDAGGGSLRDAINQANAQAPAPGDINHIDFNIAGAGAGVQTINLTSALPAITRAVVIDGFTQAGAHANSLAVGDNSTHLIEINGANAGAGVNGFTIAASNVTLRGLVINGFQQDPTNFTGGNGVVVQAGGANAILSGDFIGTNADGTQAVANQGNGVLVTGNPTNVEIGNPTVADHNVISGNSGSGIDLLGSSDNFVENNYLGTNAAGTAALGNGDDGLLLIGQSNNNTIRGNVVSGNGNDGVNAQQNLSGNVIAGNIIGLNAAGTAALGNRLNGVFLSSGASNNTLGGPTAADRNVISGNGDIGVDINEAASTENLIQGNFIGTDVTGTHALGNGSGVFVDGSLNTRILGNVISGNNFDGISSGILPANGVQIQGNKIGTNTAGTAALANGGNGIEIQDGATNVQIGGVNPGDSNLISGNIQSGVVIQDSTTSQVTLLGNLIGTDFTGTRALGNGGDGVEVERGPTQVAIGEAGAGRNVISGNGLGGVFIQKSDGTVVANDFIGTSAAGTAALANGQSGVFVEDSDNVQIKGNVLSGNGRDGVELQGANDQDLIVGNKIGTIAAGTAALGNAANGIEMSRGVDTTTIGGTAAGDGNVISGNGHDGILAGLDTFRSLIEGNFIGTDGTGLHALGNGGNGVEFTGGSGGNGVGDTTAGAGNTIAFNGGAGVAVDSGIENAILGNSIFGNGARGIVLGATELQTAPVLESVTEGQAGATTVIQVSLHSTPNKQVRVEFFVNDVADPSGFGQGQHFLGAGTVSTDANGNAAFTFVVNPALPNGSFVTATVSVFDGFQFTTSAFSNALRVGGQADPTPTPTPTPTPAPRNLLATLQQVKMKGKTVLLVVVRFADTGAVKTFFTSPFQRPAFNHIQVRTISAKGNGVADTVVLTALRNGKKKTRLIPV
jgi:titin